MTKVFWPSWRYGPNGQAAIFKKQEDVPVGWVENPADVKEPAKEPLPNSEEVWEGFQKEDLRQILRKSGEKIQASYSARKLYERAAALGLLTKKDSGDAEKE